LTLKIKSKMALDDMVNVRGSSTRPRGPDAVSRAEQSHPTLTRR
jgi:hypothetical protein